MVFRAEVKGRTLHFQYDRMVHANEMQKDVETGTSWQQATGEAIDGPLKGTRLKPYPVGSTTWAEWRKRYPDTMVLKPLPGYVDRMPNRSRHIKDVAGWAPKGRQHGARTLDKRWPARETVAGLEVGREGVAYPSRSCASRVRRRQRWRTADCHRRSALVRNDDGLRGARQRQSARVSDGE